VDLFSLRLIPESPWLTPWQADTLSGLICWAAVRRHGGDFVRSEILDAAMANGPRFVLSDAFPGDYLPVPAALRLTERPANERKALKRAKWLKRADFIRAQRGEPTPVADMIAEDGIRSYTQLRNNIARGNAGLRRGGLFSKEEWFLRKDIPYLTIYARIETDFVDTFRELMTELATWGFGADASAGKGQFHLHPNLDSADWLDEASRDGNGCVVLSSFQPAATDPTEGSWDAFTKYGKLGPDFGLENVFKRPLVLLRPGACFFAPLSRRWLGRAIPMHDLLSTDVAEDLSAQAAHVCHLAFGLSVPMNLPQR